MPRVTIEADSEILRWVEVEYAVRDLGRLSPFSTEDRIIVLIHKAIEQPVFNKALRNRDFSGVETDCRGRAFTDAEGGL